MDKIDNAIESAYRALAENLSKDNILLYSEVPDPKLQIVFSTLHTTINWTCERMNERLPTGNSTAHFWAEESRQLLNAIGTVEQLHKSLQGSRFAFFIDAAYQEIFNKCTQFLQKSNGSEIPPHMPKIEIYYAIPIFKMETGVVAVDIPTIINVDRSYIRDIATRAVIDIENSNFDSAITKSRTLLEETFCYVIELKGEVPTTSGRIGDLYTQVKQLYNMHQSKDIDNRINSLLKGLEKIVSAIAEMRNNNSDAHGVGQKRYNIEAHHARLFVNSAATMADFILAVAMRKPSIEQ